jgi:hypothetical protein
LSNKRIAVSEKMKKKFDMFKRRLELKFEKSLTQDQVIDFLLNLGRKELKRKP